MLTLYTAIGTLKFKKCPNGKSLPTVINNGQEYGLSDHELILWSCLAFQVLQIHELENAYKFRLENSDKKKALPFFELAHIMETENNEEVTDYGRYESCHC